MQNFTARRGDDFVIQLEFYNPDETVYPITSFSFTLELRRYRDQVTPDDSVNGVLDDAAGGLASFTFLDTETDLLDGTYFYDMKWTDASGLERVFASGVITFARSGNFDTPVLEITVGETEETLVTNNATAKETFKIERFSRTAQGGYTTLTAAQLAGSAVITTAETFRADSLELFRNGILMEKTIEYTEAVARTSFTLVGTYDDTDKFEARYVKN